MSTIDSREFIDNIIKNNGYYNGDSDNSLGDNPRCVKIVEYTNAWGKVTWAVIFQDDNLNKYCESEFVKQPKTIWEFLPNKFK